jgi:hypothetical protein
MKKSLVLHPFLFGLFFMLALYSANVTEVSFTDVLPPLLVVGGCVAVILLLAWLLLRDVRKAALLTSIEVILCLSYVHVVNLFDTQPATASWVMVPPESGLAMLMWLAWAMVFGMSVYFIRWYWRKRWDRNLDKLTTLFSIVGTVLLIMPVITIVLHKAHGPSHHTVPSDTSNLQLSLPEEPPDIYYIILDTYPSASTLEEEFGFDNSEFVNHLAGKGFYVAPESHANYFITLHSLSSSLNMNYLDVLMAEIGRTTVDDGQLMTMLQDYRVWRLLKTSGYEFINIGSWWEVTRENKYADVNINYGGELSEFSRLALKTSAIEPMGEILGLWGDERRIQYERVKYEFDMLSRIPEREGPTFVFAHFIVPHGDYVFQSNGDFLSAQEADRRSEESKYLDQLAAVNRLVEPCIDHLIAASDVPPMIILQGDHGPSPDLEDELGWMVAPSDFDLSVKSGILNAYYLPSVDQGALYPSITPVNSFRLVFNLYFGTDLELLADKSYYRSLDNEWIDVTERL